MGPHGVSESEVLRMAGILSGIAATAVLFAAEFVWRDRVSPATHRWLLLVGLLLLPCITLLGASATVFEETKTVASCASCHVMHPFVDDMHDPGSASLAARHFRNRWIPDHHCYACHTTYGIHGTLEGKRDGLRHWLLYVTGTWEEPIRYSGSYPNANCLACHAGAPVFERVAVHAALRPDLLSDRTSCIACHGPPHPTPAERPATRR